MKYHPIADLFPLLDEDALQSLAADIRETGLLEDIWTYEGMILDGRNRHRACELSGVAPRFQEYTGDTPYHFVRSKNIQRRDMTSFQRAFVALNMLPGLQEEAKKRQLTGVKQDLSQLVDTGRATDIVAKMFNTNRMYVHSAARLKADYPELVEEAVAGKLSHYKFIKQHKEGDKKVTAKGLEEEYVCDFCPYAGKAIREAKAGLAEMESTQSHELSILELLDEDIPSVEKEWFPPAKIDTRFQDPQTYEVTFTHCGKPERVKTLWGIDEMAIEKELRYRYRDCTEVRILKTVRMG